MISYIEFAQQSANALGSNASQIVNQLDPTMKAQWEKILADFPKLYAFLSELNKISNGSWKVTPAQFTSLLNKAIVGAAGSKGSTMSAPVATK